MIKALCLIVFMLQAGFVQAQKITWIVIDFAPYYILSDDLAGQGRDELLIKLLEQYMPEHQFDYKLFPASRAVHELAKQNSNYCMISLYKTPKRSRYIAFTENHSTTGLSTSAALTKETAKSLALGNNAIDFDALMKQHKLTVGVAANRSFGTEIDATLASLDQQQLLIRPGRDTLESLTVMLLRKRVDIILGYPSEHHYHKVKLDKQNRLTQVRLQLASQLTKGYSGCNNNELGRQHIAAIDKALQQVHQDEQYRLAMSRWLPQQLRPKLAGIFAH